MAGVVGHQDEGPGQSLEVLPTQNGHGGEPPDQRLQQRPAAPRTARWRAPARCSGFGWTRPQPIGSPAGHLFVRFCQKMNAPSSRSTPPIACSRYLRFVRAGASCSNPNQCFSLLVLRGFRSRRWGRRGRGRRRCEGVRGCRRWRRWAACWVGSRRGWPGRWRSPGAGRCSGADTAVVRRRRGWRQCKANPARDDLDIAQLRPAFPRTVGELVGQ